MIKKLSTDKHLIFVRFLLVMLAALYGLVPLFVHLSGIFEAAYAPINFWYSIALVVIILTLPKKSFFLYRISVFTERKNPLLTIIIFIASLWTFYLFPWHDDRESVGASISAFFRALWLIVVISYYNSSERARLTLLIATIILMFIDQSRTYFIIALLIIGIKSNYKKAAILLGVVLVIALGAVRSEDAGRGIDLLLYGIIGEGYNATKAVGQIYQVSNISIDTLSHILSTMLQPITLPFDIFLSKIFGESYRLQDYYLAEAVMSNLGEIFNPMGGWYIVGDFIYYGYFGVLLMAVYMHLTWHISRFILDTNYFPFGALFVFIAIKATPFVYWKFVFYIVAVSFVYKILSSIRIGISAPILGNKK